MMTILIVIFPFLLYSFILKNVMVGLKNLRPCAHETIYPRVSVIVAARNEQQSIGACVEALLAQDYPESLMEIIVVDDFSSDDTLRILNDYAAENPKFHILQSNLRNNECTDHNQGSKKRALELGIAQAAGDVLLFTDADCVPPKRWIRAMIRCFEKDVGMVIGFSPLIDKTNSFLGKLIQLDSVVAATIAASGTGMKRAITCNGRNMAYRKQLFRQVKGYDDICHSVSGDDDLFLHLVAQRTNWQILYNISSDSFVPSYQTKSALEFYRQKRRHLSAGKFYPFRIQLAYGIIHLTNLLLCVFLIGSIFYGAYRLWMVFFFLCKLIIDFVFVAKGIRIFDSSNLKKYFLCWEIFYIVYHIVFAPLSIFGKIYWREKNNH